MNGIPATARDPQGPEDTPEKLEAERTTAQEFIDSGKYIIRNPLATLTCTVHFTAEPLTEEEQTLKEQYTEAGFHDWSRRDFQQFVRALENYGWYVCALVCFIVWPVVDPCPLFRTDDYDLLASEIQDKDPKAVKRYYTYFKKHWKELAEHPRIATRITEGEAKRNKRSNLEYLLTQKITSVKYPMQELELNYPTTKGKVYSEEEDRYLLCRLNHYGMRAEDVYECIRRDISEFPVFRFDWFFKSRSTQEVQRRCNTLLGMIEKEAEALAQQEEKSKGKGKVSVWNVSS